MAELAADSLENDPRIAEARRLITEAMGEHSARLERIKPGDPERRESYEKLIGDYGAMRGGALWYPYLGSGLGRGALVELADGSVKYDFIAGIGVHFLGHNHPRLTQAGVDAALRNTVMQGNLQQNRSSADFLGVLIQAAADAGSKLEHVFLSTSGAMANENAFKIIFQKHFPARRFLAFSRCFAGRTLAMSQVTDKAANRVGQPDTIAVDHIPFYNPAMENGGLKHALATLELHLARHPGDHAGMIFELVQGEGGFIPGERAFFRAIMERLKTAGIAVLVDEIQTFGRTPRLFASEHFGVADLVDVCTIGKLTQVCATLYKDEYRPKPGLLSQTFTGATHSILAGTEILLELTEGGYYGPEGKIQRMNSHFGERIRELAEKYPGKIGGPFGIGAMVAFEVHGGDPEKTKTFVKDLYEAGVIGFIAGRNPMRVRFLLPVGAIDTADIDAVMDVVRETVNR